MSQTFCKSVDPKPEEKPEEKKGPFARLSQWFTRLSAKAAAGSHLQVERAALQSPPNVYADIRALSPDEAFMRLMESEKRAREVMTAGSHHDTIALKQIQAALFKQSGMIERMERVIAEYGQTSMSEDRQVLDFHGHQVTVQGLRAGQTYVILSGSQQNSTEVTLRSFERAVSDNHTARHYQITEPKQQTSTSAKGVKVLLDIVQTRRPDGTLFSTDVFASSSIVCQGVQEAWDKGAPKEAAETRLYKAISTPPRPRGGGGLMA